MILTQSYEDFITAKQSGLCSPEKVRYLGNGVDIDHFDSRHLNPSHQTELRQSLGIPNSANPIIGMVGRLNRRKGSGYIIEAAAQLLSKFPNLHILIIGGQLSSDPDPFQTQIVEQIKTLDLENHVTLTGYRSDIPELLGLLDVFTLPTFNHEGLPRSILEAMAMGLPVVTTDIRGCRETVIDGQTGFIVPPQNVTKLSEALEKIMADATLGQRLGQAGRQRVESEYDEQLVFQRLQTIYQDLGLKVKPLVKFSQLQGTKLWSKKRV